MFFLQLWYDYLTMNDFLLKVEILGNVFYAFVFVLGLCIGSFLNSWIWRTYANMRILAKNRSICPHCGHQLPWYENIPLFSWIFLRCRCSQCHRAISWQYPLVEFFTGALMVLVFYNNLHTAVFNPWQLFRDVLFLIWLMIIFVYDFRYQIILTGVVWVASAVGFCLNVTMLNINPSDLILGMIIASGFFYLQYFISKGKWIGGGDVRMGVMIGAWLGWQNAILALFVAYISGALVAIYLLLRKKANGETAIPFGTFLAIGTLFSLYYGTAVIHWYVGLLK